ncbi:MAG: tetratricopeptide repeat protein [Planctomycetota bacterium]
MNAEPEDNSLRSKELEGAFNPVEEPLWAPDSLARPLRRPVHPLFDEASLYRLAIQDSLSLDGGRASIASFLQTLRGATLDEQWLDEVPSEPQDWGYADAVNRMIHQWRLKAGKSAQGTEKRQTVPGGVGGGLCPSLIVGHVEESQAIFWGKPQPFRSPSEDRASDAPPNAFEIIVGDLPRERWCLVLIVTQHLLGQLSNAMALDGPARQDSSSEWRQRVLLNALSVKTMSPRQDTREKMDRAFRVSTTLALAPTLEGMTDSRGQLDMLVELPWPCPPLRPDTCVVVCVSPDVGSRRYSAGERPRRELGQLARYRHELANDCYRKGDFEKALEHYRQVIEIKPDSLETWFNLGLTYTRTEQYDEALAAFDKVTELAPEVAEVHYCRGLIHERRLEDDLAITNYRRALEVDPCHPEAETHMRAVQQRKSDPAAGGIPSSSYPDPFRLHQIAWSAETGEELNEWAAAPRPTIEFPIPPERPRLLTETRGAVHIAQHTFSWLCRERLNGDVSFSITGPLTTAATSVGFTGRTCELWRSGWQGEPWKRFKLEEVEHRGEVGGVTRIRKDERTGVSAGQETRVLILLRAGVLVVDCSATPASETLLAAKRACKDFIATVDFATRKIGLIQSGMERQASVLCPLCPDRDVLTGALEELRCAESSPLAEAIESATAMLDGCPPDADRFMVLLVNSTPDEPRRAIAASRRAREAGIEIFSLALPGADCALLSQLVSDSQKMLAVEDLSQLTPTVKCIGNWV